MLYAIIETGGKQFHVEKGMTLNIPTLDVASGSTVTFDRVLLCSNGAEVCVGTPTVARAKVTAVSLGEAKGEKVVIFKMRRRKASTCKTGHRQKFTAVRVMSIDAPIQERAAPEKTAPPAAAPKKKAQAPAAAPQKKQ